MDTLNMFHELERLLRMDSRYCTDDGTLLKNRIIEDALSVNPLLIKQLLAHTGLKNNFFTEVDGVLVFDKVKFQRFVMNKSFLADSYTAFKNKIGLTDEDGRFISESREMVLSWPYKDCMLEGGQTKEDAKRDEIFWNEILAPDEINRLTESKVFSNFKRYDKDGEHTVEHLSANDNLIIKGNNLLALHSLKKKYAGRIKLIYVDVPYNTGSDSFGYNDKFSHSTWLTFMKNRLEISKELLSDDGNIVVNADWNEVHYCKILMDSIFTRDCFRNEIIWCYTGPGSPKMKQLNRKHDNLLWYSKSSESWAFYGDDVRMKSEVHVGGFNGEMSADVSDEYTEKGKIPEDWWELFHTVDDLKSEFDLLQKEKSKITSNDWWKEAVASRIRVDGKKRTGFLTEKPYKLMERIVKMLTQPGDIVLDFCAGSGTTGFVSDYLKRQYVLVEQMDNQIEIMKKRFDESNFVYCELAKANAKFADEIEDAKITDELKEIWERMKATDYLNYKVDIKKVDANAVDFDALSLDDQKRFLFECLDKNLLYVPLSDIDSNEYGVTEEDKRLTMEFYNKEK